MFTSQFLTSCHDLLEKDPTDSYSETVAWSSESSLDMYVTYLYKPLNGLSNFSSLSLTDGYTDLVKYGNGVAQTWSAHNKILLQQNTITSDNNPMSSWGLYTDIFRENVFLRDAGIYGMAGLILELLTKEEADVKVKVVPGVTASIGAAAVLGAPIMHDFCHISLSDLMTPWEVIEKRLRLAAEADFVICLYNPRSKGRSEHLAKAFEIMGEFKDKSTPVGIVKDVGRADEEKIICTFETMDFEKVDMTTKVIIGNKATYIHDDLMITPRGYTV